LRFLVRQIPVLEIVGRELQTSMREGRVFQEVPDFWEACDRDGTTLWLREHAGALGVCGVSLGIDHGGGPFRFLACVESPTESSEPPAGFRKEVLPVGEWAVFGETGPLPHTLQALIRTVHTAWIPSHTEWSIDRSINLVRYPTYLQGTPRGGDDTPHECELWMPIRARMGSAT